MARRRADCACCARCGPSWSRSSSSTKGRLRPGGPTREPDLEVEGARLWRIPSEGIAEAFADRQLLIADGHHRYETALAYGEDTDVLAVLVSLDDPGLMIFPTHRLFEHEPAERLAGRGGSR